MADEESVREVKQGGVDARDVGRTKSRKIDDLKKVVVLSTSRAQQMKSRGEREERD